MFSTVAERVIPRVIIELDFDADPDTDPAVVQADIADQIPAYKLPVALDGDRMIFEGAADAFAARLRYGAHVVRVITEAE